MAVLYLMKSLARILSLRKAQSLRSFFLGGPSSSQALTSFVAFVLRTLREEPVVAGDHIGLIYIFIDSIRIFCAL
jgi:hypothetical protein